MGVTTEIATVYRGGGRRYFSRASACRGEAKAIIRRSLREQGEDDMPSDMFHREVTRMALQIKAGLEPTLDWDEVHERDRQFFARA